MDVVTLESGRVVPVGCLVDGWWGQYASDRVIRLGVDLGWVPPTDMDAMLLEYVDARLEEMGGGPDASLVGEVLAEFCRATDSLRVDLDMVDEWRIELSDDVIDWLNSQLPIGPSGEVPAVFEWVEGEFFLTALEEGEEPW